MRNDMKSFNQFCDEHQVNLDEKKSLLYYLIAIRMKHLIDNADHVDRALLQWRRL